MSLKSNIITMAVDVTDVQKVIEAVKSCIASNQSSYICVSNVHMCMETFDSLYFRQLVNSADLVIPDGRPIFWAQRILGFKDAHHVRGQDITEALCEISHREGINIGLYGGSSDTVLSNVVAALSAKYPNIKITYQYSPPFRALTSSETDKVIDDINNAKVDVLFVGIGCPKQEIWMAQQKGKINAVMLGVGAAYDFISGEKKHAPKLLQKLGLEWLYRLCSEPKRLWKRYLKQNPRFIWYFTRQVIFKKQFDI